MFRFTILLVIFGLNQSLGQLSLIDCSDLKEVGVVGPLFLRYSKKIIRDEDFSVNFIITTNKNKNLMDVNPGDWRWFKETWDIDQKTYVIVHGFKSSGKKPWVSDMAKKLVEKTKGNVIIVDWSAGSNVFNYADAAKNTQIAGLKTARFIRQLLREHDKLYENIAFPDWVHLHFIGHSLGAQISAQVSYILKWNNIWQIDRITGLDPAKPCFKNNTLGAYKLDKFDAEFVDVIHTQVGLGGVVDGLGLKEPIGHMDFYVNSGVVQPKCLGSFFTMMWDTMICSHKLATKYFIESLSLPRNNTCAFRGYAWDGTFMQAQNILTKKLNEPVCYNCPEMGIYADQSSRNGTYLVLTGEDEPFCDLRGKDTNDIVKVFWKFKGATSLFNL